ncbi:Spy/CpxP family protein refolding chaperone [Legionella londiniensis]|uniref:16 kD immunogenic protein n=1 Tax=Legionella londiniensis TaxID=45068 RepID=A0A0W0VPB2_9GAMM|nr:Spy/CpxP family protein refolding chaperone [Legionella londiniensis]KTD21622.1 16 kD immunogenic protein [Legionella londiniensis]STX93393.1 16 kD immunogenic protein [Legionella londiniensis]
MKKIILLPLMALALAISPVAFADKMCPCMDIQKMEKELNLTADQKNKIMEIRKQAKEQMKATWEQMKALHQQKKELVRSEKMDQAKLDELVNQKKELMASMMKTKIMTQHQIYNVLDENQKEKFAAMMDKWEQKKMEKMEKMKNMEDDSDDETDE